MKFIEAHVRADDESCECILYIGKQILEITNDLQAVTNEILSVQYKQRFDVFAVPWAPTSIVSDLFRAELSFNALIKCITTGC